MGRYFRTVEMGRFQRFRCPACAGEMAERLLGAKALELTCAIAPCDLVLLVETTEPIPARPLPPGSVRYRDGGPLEHGEGFRCLNCGRELLPRGKPARGNIHTCPRCNTTIAVGSSASPPARRSTDAHASASGASGWPAATAASAARST